MTIDEAIENLNGMYEYTRYLYDSNAEYENVLCKRYKQLAEWLEELKCYRNENNFSEYADRLYKNAYNKALDDFLKKLKHEYSVLAKELPKEYKSVCENFEKIAEELRK